MKSQKEQLEIMTAALLIKCHGIYSKEAIGNEIAEFTDRVVKIFAIHDTNNAKRTCPRCGSDKVIIFTADEDLCQKCGKSFPGV